MVRLFFILAMTAKHITLRPGRAAIAAVLALTPASLFAQDAATDTTGPIVVPAQNLPSTASAPTAAPAPTIVLPDVSPATTAPTTTTTNTTTTAPATTTSTPATANRSTSTTMRRATTTASRTLTAAPRTSAPAPVTAQTAPVANEAALPVAEAPVSAPVVAEPAAPITAVETPVESQREDVTEALAQILAGLLVAGVAIGGLVMLMSRRRRITAEAVPVIERPIVREPVPFAEREVQLQPLAQAPTTNYMPASSTGATLPAASGAAVALPREAPEDPVARGELLKQMVEAEPDKANPFRSPRARLRRARLILQSLGRRFESSAPRFDLSDYTSNWPALARRTRLATA